MNRRSPLLQVFGRKEVVLFSPEQSELLRPFSAAQHPHLRNTSQLDLADPGLLQANEGLRSASWVHCILRPGEALHIPKGWWHFVRALDPSLSVNFWWTKQLTFRAKRS